MSTAIATPPAEPMGRILIPIPKRLIAWLEREALRRKHELGQSRMAKAPIVVELIEEAALASEKPAATKRKKGEGAE